MQFNSLSSSNTSDYAAAGKSAADSAAKSFAIQRKTGPDYAGLSKVAMKTSAEEKIASIKASAKMTKAGIDAYSETTQMGQKVAVVNDKIDRFEKQKMAGSLAAIGNIAGAGYLASRDNTKGRERPKADLQGALDKYKESVAKMDTRHKAERDAIAPYKSVSSTGDEPGKVSTEASTSDSLVASKPSTYSNDFTGTYNIALQAGFKPEDARIMAGIGGAESSYNPKAHNPNASTGDNSYGIFQINMLGGMGPERRKHFGIESNEQLFDPLTNAKAAKKIFDSQGFNAWSVHRSGKYKDYMQS